MSVNSENADVNGVQSSREKKSIPGGLPYSTYQGTLKNMLEKVIEVSKPEKFNYDFVSTVMGSSGGAARATIPLFKKIGFVDSNNAPTELYSKFRTDRKRGLAVYEGLKNGFSEIFKRSEFAYSLSDDKITDIIVEITGLSKSDRTVSAIKSTFLTLCSYLPTNFRHDVIENGAVSEVAVESSSSAFEGPPSEKASVGNVGLSYNINIVLPETSDVAVLNAIFKSLKANILQ